MKITYYGHSCFLVETGSSGLLFDPFISPNPLAEHISIDEIKIDFILLSHGHSDHVADTEVVYQNNMPTLISNFEVATWFQKKGLEKIHPMNHGGKWAFDFGTVKLVNAVHSSSMPDGSYGGNPQGFVVQAGSHTFYYAGDTALHQDMKQIGEEFTIDFAFLPIGDNFTMGIEDALIAADYVNTKKIIAMHYDTFPYIEIDHEKVKRLAREAGKEIYLLKIGSTIDVA